MAQPLNPSSVQTYLRLEPDAYRVLKRRADEAGLAFTVYLRGILEREAMENPDERFIDHLTKFWGYRGQGDPNEILGAVARAKGLGMPFGIKFRQALKVLLDHSLL